MALGELRRNKYITAVRRSAKASFSSTGIKLNVTFRWTWWFMRNPVSHDHTHTRQNKYKRIQLEPLKDSIVLEFFS